MIWVYNRPLWRGAGCHCALLLKILIACFIFWCLWREAIQHHEMRLIVPKSACIVWRTNAPSIFFSIPSFAKNDLSLQSSPSESRGLSFSGAATGGERGRPPPNNFLIICYNSWKTMVTIHINDQLWYHKIHQEGIRYLNTLWNHSWLDNWHTVISRSLFVNRD